MSYISLKEKAMKVYCHTHNDSIRFLNISSDQILSHRGLCADCEFSEKVIKIVHAQAFLNQLEDYYVSNVQMGVRVKEKEFSDLIKICFNVLEEFELKMKQQIAAIQSGIDRFRLKFNSELQGFQNYHIQEGISFPALQFYKAKEYLNLQDLDNLGSLLSTFYNSSTRQLEVPKMPLDTTQLDSLIKNLQTIVTSIVKQTIYDTNKVQKLSRHAGIIFSFSLNSSETQLLSGSKGQINNLLLWEMNRHKEWRIKEIYKEHTDNVFWVQFSGRSNYFISAGQDKKLIIWRQNQLGLYNKEQVLEGHTDAVVHFQQDNFEETLASCSWDKTIRIWHKGQNNLYSFAQTLAKHRKQVLSVSFNRKGNLLASGGQDNQVILWTKVNGNWEFMQSLSGHRDSVTRVLFDNGSANELFTSSSDKSVRIWKQNDDLKYQQHDQLEEHDDKVNSISISRNDQLMVTASQDKTLRIWNRMSHSRRWYPSQTIHQDFSPFFVLFSEKNSCIFSRSFKDILIFKQTSSVN